MSIEAEKRAYCSDMGESSLKALITTSAVVEVMAKVTPDINEMLETNMLSISESFTEIAQSGRSLQDRLESASSGLPLDEMKAEVEKINQNVAQVIIGMQFQDRLSQNLVILRDISEELQSTISGDLAGAEGDVDLDGLKRILELIKLGEIKNVFVDYLMEAGYIKSHEEIGHQVVDGTSSGADEIELF